MGNGQLPFALVKLVGQVVWLFFCLSTSLPSGLVSSTRALRFQTASSPTSNSEISQLEMVNSKFAFVLIICSLMGTKACYKECKRSLLPTAIICKVAIAHNVLIIRAKVYGGGCRTDSL